MPELLIIAARRSGGRFERGEQLVTRRLDLGSFVFISLVFSRSARLGFT